MRWITAPELADRRQDSVFPAQRWPLKSSGPWPSMSIARRTLLQALSAAKRYRAWLAVPLDASVPSRQRLSWSTGNTGIPKWGKALRCGDGGTAYHHDTEYYGRQPGNHRWFGSRGEI